MPRNSYRLWTVAVAISGLLAFSPGMRRLEAQPPGPELFAIEPRTAVELWGAIDYLIRTGQAQKAIPYLEKFSKMQVDLSTWVAIRDRYGPGSVLRLSDSQATLKYAEPLVTAYSTAMRAVARNPERMQRFLAELTGSEVEQDFGIRHLREAGSYAAPQIATELARTDLAPEVRSTLIRNLGRLDRTVVPGMAALLESPDLPVATAAATILGEIGHSSALPFLAYPAASPQTPAPLQAAAQTALASITHRVPRSASRTPVQILVDAVWAYHRHQVEFDDDPAVIWKWDAQTKSPVPVELPRTQAEAMLGLKFAEQALQLDPGNLEARVAQLSLTLDKGLEQTGYREFKAKQPALVQSAKASEPATLSEVLRAALRDHRDALAATAADLLGQTLKPPTITLGQLQPLVEALRSPGRRARFAAARALVELEPRTTFPGASLVIPTLGQFVVYYPLPRAIVIDTNPSRGSQLSGLLDQLHYDCQLEVDPELGFRAAASSASVELVLISYDLFRSGWKLPDSLTNLRTDARTADIPLVIYAHEDLSVRRPNLARNYPEVRFIIQPLDPVTLQAELGKQEHRLSDADRAYYAHQAAALLSKVAANRHSLFHADLARVENALAIAAGVAQADGNVVSILSATPTVNAQRILADLALNPSLSAAAQSAAVRGLIVSIKHFGPLISAEQEERIAAAAKADPSPDQGLAKVVAALEAIARGARR